MTFIQTNWWNLKLNQDFRLGSVPSSTFVLFKWWISKFIPRKSRILCFRYKYNRHVIWLFSKFKISTLWVVFCCVNLRFFFEIIGDGIENPPPLQSPRQQIGKILTQTFSLYFQDSLKFKISSLNDRSIYFTLFRFQPTIFYRRNCRNSYTTIMACTNTFVLSQKWVKLFHIITMFQFRNSTLTTTGMNEHFNIFSWFLLDQL